MLLKTGCFIFLFLISLQSWASIPEVKVLIAKKLKNIVVEGIDLKKTIHSLNKSHQYSGRKKIKFNCHSSKKTDEFPKNSFLVASLSSPTGLISWGENKYKGKLQLLINSDQKACDLVNMVPMESYLMTLLSKEMNGTWPVEALKAQAVAARTYAYDRIRKGLSPRDKHYHLESSEKDQVSGTYFDITEKTVRAAKETEGEILVGPTGKITPAFFHSKCGGKTLRPDQVWGGVEEGYRSVDCKFCKRTGMKNWKVKLKKVKLTDMIDKVLAQYYGEDKNTKNKELRVMPDHPLNSELRLYRGDRLHIVKKSYIRNLAGRKLLPSNNYVLSLKNKDFFVEGQGYGHGVGLCQLGALELAKRGYNYKQILSFYFPRHRMKKAY